jgi:hypothetical protein
VNFGGDPFLSPTSLSSSLHFQLLTEKGKIKIKTTHTQQTNSLFHFKKTSRLMAAPPARARADYDYLIKLLLIGDSGKLFLPFHLFSFFIFILYFK